MKLRLSAFTGSLIIAAIVALAAVASSCDGDSKGGDPTTVPVPTDPSGTPVPFEVLRDDLADELDAIGPNIGAVPPDVQQQLLVQCGQLVNFVDRDEVAPLCNAIDKAIERNDPGSVDNIVDLLRALKED